MIKLLTLILIPLILSAQDLTIKPQPQPQPKAQKIKFPTVGFEKSGVTTGDYNLFDSSRKSYGMYRYGGGMSRFRIGDGIGIFMTSRAGTYLLPPNKSPFVLGIEPVGGIFNIDTSDRYDSFYELTPVVSSGLAYKVTNDYMFALLGKYGFSVGNMQRDDLTPTTGSAWGYSFILNKTDNGIFYDYYKIKGEDCYSGGVFLDSWGISVHKIADRYEYYQIFFRLFNM